MQHFDLRQFGRTILTIVGIVLLIIFGTRAASQATSLAAVEGQPQKSELPLFVNGRVAALNGITTAGTMYSYAPMAMSAVQKPSAGLAARQASADTSPSVAHELQHDVSTAIAAVGKKVKVTAKTTADTLPAPQSSSDTHSAQTADKVTQPQTDANTTLQTSADVK